MSGSWGKNLQLAIFGESHGPAIGISISGLPAGLILDFAEISREMLRRAPGHSPLATARREKDQPQILSGLYQGKTTGTPLCAVIVNQDNRSQDYEKLGDLMRPGHSDYPGFIHYGGFQDPRGGGHFSGRITAPLLFAGAVCKQVLRQQGIWVAAHIQSIGDIQDLSFDQWQAERERLKTLGREELPLLDPSQRSAMEQAILQAKACGDSVGGVVECAIFGLAPGVGEPFFDSVEATLAHLLFSIPGIKGVEFGLGFAMANRLGSQCNDLYYYEGETVKTKTNHCGGVLGGLSTGMPVVFRAVVRPTASIAQVQQTISLAEGKEAKLSLAGRHDPCIVQRALPVIEGVAAIGILELLKERQAWKS